MSALEQANQATIERFTNGIASLFARYLRLGIGLSVVYAVCAGGYVAVVFGPLVSQAARLAAASSPWRRSRSSSSSRSVNFVYLLLQIVVATEDCAVHEAIPHVARLLRRRTRDVGQVLAAILALDVDGHGRVDSRHRRARPDRVRAVRRAWWRSRFSSLRWLVRGVVFQFIGLTGVATYLRLHRTLQPADAARATDRPAATGDPRMTTTMATNVCQSLATRRSASRSRRYAAPASSARRCPA